MLLIGEKECSDTTFFRNWIDSFLEADIDSAFNNPMSAVSSMMEVAFLGERRIYARLRKMLYPIVEAEIEACIAGKPLPANPSVLTSFLRYRFEHDFNRNVERFKLVGKRTANTLIFFSFAAISNSYTIGAWTLWHILMDTHGIGMRICNEMKINDDTNVDISQILEHTILEVTRLYTPGNVYRKVKKPLVLPSDGTEIEKDTTIVVNMFHAMRQGFSDPLSFDPDRFARGEAKKHIFITFGWVSIPALVSSWQYWRLLYLCKSA
jgi:cytochrome P450